MSAFVNRCSAAVMVVLVMTVSFAAVMHVPAARAATLVVPALA